MNYIFLPKTPNFPCGASMYCLFWNYYKLYFPSQNSKLSLRSINILSFLKLLWTIFSFSKLQRFQNVSLNTFSSPYVLKMKLFKHCYMAISAVSMFKVTLSRLKPPVLWYWACSSSNEVPCQWNVIDKPIVILSSKYETSN